MTRPITSSSRSRCRRRRRAAPSIFPGRSPTLPTCRSCPAPVATGLRARGPGSWPGPYPLELDPADGYESAIIDVAAPFEHQRLTDSLAAQHDITALARLDRSPILGHDPTLVIRQERPARSRTSRRLETPEYASPTQLKRLTCYIKDTQKLAPGTRRSGGVASVRRGLATGWGCLCPRGRKGIRNARHRTSLMRPPSGSTNG